MDYKIELSCSEGQIKNLEAWLNGSRIDYKVVGVSKRIRKIDSDFESKIIEEYITFADSRETAEILQPYKLLEKLEEKSGEKLDPKKFGSAMKNLGFGKQCVRFEGKPKHVYLFKWI